MDHHDRPPQQVEVIYTDEEIDSDREEIIASKVSVNKDSVKVRATKSTAYRLAQQFGGIPGVPVGAEWENRQGCSSAGVHRPLMAGIHGTKKSGAFSIVVSCHYKDDKDFGDTIYYTGTGGRKRWSDSCPPKRIRLGPQIFDQQWSDRGNEALVTSRDTGNPVRVVRSHKVLSDFAPADGYRYDGLYTVESAWKEKNPKGLDICRYRLERVPGQPPLPRRSLADTGREPSPASVATSDTVVPPACTVISHKRKTRPSAPQDDPLIYTDAVFKKRKLADRAPPQSSASLSPFAGQQRSLAPVLVTTETPLQKHNQLVQKEVQKEKQQHFPGTRSSAEPSVKRQPLHTLTKPRMWFSQSELNDPARLTRSLSYDEDNENADMPFDDEAEDREDLLLDDEEDILLDGEDEEDSLLEDLETTASPFSSFLFPSPF